MGIIIQAVVGTRVGCYFLPAFTGAASSINECRWSARLKREDGLLRLVPGLGTRLAHYSADECPVFAVPAKPGSQDPATIRENVCRAPKRIDVINLESETVETVLISELLKKYGAEYPEVQRIFSTENGDHTPQPLNGTADFSREKPIVTFDGLLTDSRFMKQLELILRRLAARLNTPVEFEFASDGRRLYLLKCQTHDPAYTADGAKSPFGSYPAAAIRRADPWERCLPMVRQLAAGLDSERFGECKLYIANNERTAQSASTDPIDIFVLGRGTDDQRELLQLWIEGWMLCLDETYALKYGPQNGNLLQIHLVNENDPAGQTTHRDLREAAHHGFISLPCGRNSRT